MITDTPIENGKRLLTPQEVADFLQVSRWTVYDQVRKGQLKAVRIGKGLRFRPEEVERFVNRKTTGR